MPSIHLVPYEGAQWLLRYGRPGQNVVYIVEESFSVILSLASINTNTLKEIISQLDEYLVSLSSKTYVLKTK